MKSEREMRDEYLEYLKNHLFNVKNAFEWMKLNFEFEKGFISLVDKLIREHDISKFDYDDEFYSYMKYFYGDKTPGVKEEFNKAWLHHIHKNPHHWQYWILFEDEGNVMTLDMPIEYIYEMVCDWWSFSWSHNDLFEIFSWYEEHKNKMALSPNTRIIVESILDKILENLQNG